jgi:prefoldin subunit 5
LESKARFIAQVMSGQSDLRRIEDIDGAALTYAEVKAIASGNPMVIEKASVDAEVARLSRLRSQHTETQFRLRSRIRHLTEELPRLEQRLEDMRRDLATRQNTGGDKFVMTIEGQMVRDRGVAGELPHLLRRAERMRGTRAERLVGTLGGFQLFVADNVLAGPEIVIKGATTYVAKATDTALGTIRSVEHAIQHLDDLATSLARNIADVRKRLADSREQADAPFEYAQRLATLVGRQQEIEDALDLTKGQAVASLPSQPDAGEASAETSGAMRIPD